MKATSLAMACSCLKRSYWLIFTIFLLFSSHILHAQKANLSQENLLVLIGEVDSSLPYMFEFKSINPLTNSVSNLKKIYNSDISTISVNRTSGAIFISIEKRMKPNWGILEWNIYLEELYQKSLTNK